MRQQQMRARAFTLIELLLVMVILAVLAAVVVPKFANRSQQAKDTAAKTDLASIGTSLDAFEIDNGRYPTTEEGIAALTTPPPSLATTWKGPYLKKAAVADPWGNPYVYRFPGQGGNNTYDLYSTGPDGREGTDDIVP